MILEESRHESILTLIKLDVHGLFKRIKNRKDSYMDVFSVRRTREHFPEIFFNKYRDISINLLSKISPEIIISIDEFYIKADEIKWYLMTTQDMPATVEENVDRMITLLERAFYNLDGFLDKTLNSNMMFESV